jgi:radical SAM superfamily enzyme YgiQ (UPF0313 family)
MPQHSLRSLDFLFVHVPKYSNYYRLADDFMFINYVPMGVFALCDLLNKHGVKARIKHVGLETILDPEFSLVRWLEQHRVPVIGMSLHWHYQAFDVIALAEKLKRAYPETVIVLGGFTASRFAREILENFSAIDAIIVGDADNGIVPFAEAVLRRAKDFSNVANCVWRRGDSIVENGISFTAQAADLDVPDFANLTYVDHCEQYRDYFRLPMFWSNNASVSENLKRRMGPEKLFPLAVGRGCNVNCSFCGGGQHAHQRLFGREQAVYRSVSRVVDTMEQALSFGYTGFLSCFDPNPADDRYQLRWMEEIRRRGLQCDMCFESWGLPTRAFMDAFTKTFSPKHSYIALSAESGSEEIRRWNKGIYYSNQQLFDCMEELKQHRIATLIYLTMGLPGETPAHLEQTVQLAQELKRRYRSILEDVLCLPIQLEPASDIFEDPAAHGVRASRACFMDFYRSHGRTDTGPFTYLGYSTLAMGDDEASFALRLQQQRCEQYCVLHRRLPAQLGAKPLSRFICNRIHASWRRRGFGSPAHERKTFE